MLAAAIATVLLIALVFARVPVSLALMASAIAGLVMLDGLALTISQMGRIPFRSVSEPLFLIVPLFVLMGAIIANSSIASDGFAVAARLFRRIPGSLGISTVAACAAFAAVSGSSVATASTVARVSIEELRRAGYPDHLSAGVVASAGTLGILIPPSVGLVMYGIIARESVGKLLLAGFIPGVISAIVYAGAIVVYALRFPPRPQIKAVSDQQSLVTTPAGPAAVTVKSFPRQVLGSTRVIAIAVVVLGGLYSGLATTIEVAALGASLALFFFIVEKIRDRNVFRSIASGMRESVLTTGMIFALLIGGTAFTTLLVRAGIPVTFSNWILANISNPRLLVVAALLVFIPLGMFLDPLSALLIAVPIFHPVVVAAGLDGIWFAILVMKTIEIGLITPPFGLNVFVVAGTVDGLSVSTAFRGAMLFLPLDVLTIAVLFAFPQLTLWLPNAVL